MHVPDHFLSDPTSIATAVVAGAGVVAALVTTRRDARTRVSAVTPLAFAGTTAVVFALQMLNYPVASGTSGHLLGGALAAALLGPAWGVVSLTAVLAVQGLVFADGGLSALGTNVLLMALVGTLVGWWVMRGVARLASSRHPMDDAVPRAPAAVALVSGSAAVGAAVSVVAAALVFVALFAVGGTASVSLGMLMGQMLGVHALIGVGEAVITGAVVAVVAVAAPGWAAADPRMAREAAPARRAATVLGVAAVAAAGLLSPIASSAPDGLEATAEAVGFAGMARDHALAGFPLADYGEVGGLSVQLVGLIGLAICAVSAFAVGRVLGIGRLPQLAGAADA
jgi:cobalt/nickel transport system permease protein